MGTKKKTAPQDEELLKEEPVEELQEQPQLEKQKEAAIPQEIDNLLRLYPQYKELWVTKDGFVHPKNVSPALREDATLYQNKYYEQK